MASPKERNCSIDIFRYICAIMVVMIHTTPLSDFNEKLGYVFSQIIPRIAVPFFFATSGYYYIPKLESKQHTFLPYIKRLLSTYFIWSCLYYLVDFLQKNPLSLKEFISHCIYNFLINGSHYHFWFFPALIFAVCFTTLMFKLKLSKLLIPLNIILYILGCLGCSYYNISIHIPIFKTLFTFSEFTLIRRIFLMGFPFFICGYVVYKIKDNFLNKFRNKQLLLFWVSSLVIWLSEILIVRTLKWETNIVITFGLYPLVIATLLVLLNNPLSQYKLLAKQSKLLANFTYYAHPLIIICLYYIAHNIIHINLPASLIFILTISLSYLGGIIIYKWNNPFINQIIN